MHRRSRFFDMRIPSTSEIMRPSKLSAPVPLSPSIEHYIVRDSDRCHLFPMALYNTVALDQARAVPYQRVIVEVIRPLDTMPSARASNPRLLIALSIRHSSTMESLTPRSNGRPGQHRME